MKKLRSVSRARLASTGTAVFAALVIGVLAWVASDVPASEVASSSPAVGTLIIPVEGVERTQLRDSFHDGRVGHLHGAVDIMAPRGTPVIAAVDGTIRKLFTSRLGGLTIYEFDQAEARSYYYAHLDRYASIHEGQRVHRGDVIGFVGSTGNANTPHRHFAINVLPAAKDWWKGVAIDPYPELMAHGITKPASALPARLSDSR